MSPATMVLGATDLAAMQADFTRWLRQPRPATAARLGLAAPGGLLVYQNNYRASLMACLAETLPHTRSWLGAPSFDAAAAHYIEAHPPHSWTLDAFPADFPAFLAAALPDTPAAAELAALEWQLGESFVAEDAAVLGLGDIAAIDWDRAVLRLVPSARLLHLRSNAPALWSALAAGSAPPAALLHPAPQPLLVWREGFTCCFRPLAEEEAALIPALMQGLGFAELCAGLAARLGEATAVAQAGQLLAGWLGEGLLIGGAQRPA